MDCSKIDLETLRLKGKIAEEAYHGHSCDQCKDFEIPPIPSTAVDRHPPFFKIRTTPTKIRKDFVASECTFWIMIQTQLDYIYSKAQESYGSKSLRISQPLGIEEHDAGRDNDSGVGYTCISPDFVEVDVEYASLNEFADNLVVVKVAVKLFMPEMRKGHRACVVAFLPMALPGHLADRARKCISTPINLNPRSPNTMNLIKQWIRKCDIEHKCGIGNRPHSMPSLLLDLSDQDRIKLIRVPYTMRERYIALSYLWGTERQSVMLKKRTENSLFSGVRQQDFDSTIRDSITVVRLLGFRYLWIDALCIYQDDEKFKAAELGKMGDIYRNACFTIAASAANGVREGFLTRRAPELDGAEGQRPYIFEVAVRRKEGADASAILWQYNGEALEPWYTRAWTLQELLFSRRRLEFRAKQTMWTCNCSTTAVRDCDGWIAPTPDAGTRSSSDMKLYDNIAGLLRNPDSPSPVWKILWYWYELVDKYSQRALKYPEDRLPAISGVAKVFASTLKDEYVCGLWKLDLPSGLLWQVRNPVPCCPSDEWQKQKPSWSWTSYPGQVFWQFWSFKDSAVLRSEDFEILGYDMNFAVPNAVFGGVTGARLTVRGLLKSINLSEMAFRADDQLDAEFWGGHASINLDYKNDQRVQQDSNAKLAFLLIKNDKDSAWGVVLAVEEGNAYTRVGLFKTWANNYHENKESRREREAYHRAYWRKIWGGEKNKQSLVLI